MTGRLSRSTVTLTPPGSADDQRNPVGLCWSALRQHFALGEWLTVPFETIGTIRASGLF